MTPVKQGFTEQANNIFSLRGIVLGGGSLI
jgi:hypothetical protein